MKALDTNILVRFLSRDDEAQMAIAGAVIKKAQEAGTRLFVPLIVLCELIWVLLYSYELTKAELIAILERLLTTDVFEVERSTLAAAALDKYRNGRAGFADYLIGEIARFAGCDETLTFDRKLKGSPGFRVL